MKKLITAALFVAWGAAGPLAAMDLSIAGSAGLHFPNQQAFRDVYGTAAAFSLEVRWLATPNIGFSAGFMSLNKDGTAVSQDGGTDEFGVNLKLTGIPLTGFVHLPSGRFGIDLGGGLAYHNYKETWVDNGGPATEGRKLGLLAFASVAYELTPRLSVVGIARYFGVPTGRPSLLTDDVNLGGFQLLVGVSWTVVR